MSTPRSSMIVARWTDPALLGRTRHARLRTDVVLLAAGVPLAIGVLFGFYPEYPGMRMRPIDGLRYE